MASRSTDGKSLVIVESPAKARTINKYLGDAFIVKASMGHVRDLPEHDFGIDIEQSFRPTYEVVRGRTKVIQELRKLANAAPAVYLATDRDREGEAIAWHLLEALSLPESKAKRVIFNEITKNAIREAFQSPHGLDMDRVNAQQARRILDRIVGYELSPLLWRKIAKGLSAGRVQSVAVRLIVDREREIRAFVPEESWKIVAFVTADPSAAAGLAPQWAGLLGGEPSQKDLHRWLSEHGALRIELAEIAGEPFSVNNAEAVRKVAEALGLRVQGIQRKPWDEYAHRKLELAELVGAFDRATAPPLRLSDLTTKGTTTRPPGPFTTAALQQQASTQLRFAASRTMRIAQALYEGVDLHGEGPVGLITYMRTDSTNIAQEALDAVRGLIRSSFGPRYLPEHPNYFGKRQARAQEAHEAIRPTDPARSPESLRSALTDEQYRLYDLIWRRFVACQMSPAEWESTSLRATAETVLGPAVFTGSGRKLLFDGFMKVAGVSSEDQILPPLSVGGPLGWLDLQTRQHFTAPPPRYTEASLVKALESDGIGRPSTYASIIDTIQDRGYVEQDERKFYPTALGEIVTDKLVEHFPKLMDVKFTSFMENELDKIEEAHLDWVHVLHEFYDPFRDLLARALEEMEPVRSQPSDYVCAACGSSMVYRWSKTGRFLACSTYPKCKHTQNVDRAGRPVTIAEGEHACDQCGKPMALRQSKRGYFLGCTGYPECRNTAPCDASGKPLELVTDADVQRPCDACHEGTLIVKWKRLSAFLGCDRYPQCKNVAKLPDGVYLKRPAAPKEESGVACAKCGRPMLIRVGKRGKFIACSGYPRCRNSHPIEKLAELKAAADAQSAGGEHAGNGASASGAAGAGGGRGGAPQPGTDVPGFAWTRTGRLVVETLPGEQGLNCPECGSHMELRRGRFGPFFSCTGFPRCKFVCNLRGQAKKDAEELLPAPQRPKPVETDIACDECGSKMLIRQGQRGKFLGCSNYPKCRATRELPPELSPRRTPAPSGAGA